MTVAYEAGVASSPADLISKLGTFAAANGWTVSAATVGVVFRNGDINVGVNTDASIIYLRGAVGYDSGAAWNAQPGASPQNISSNVGAGPYTAYHFFVGDEADSDHVHCALEIEAGIYRHISFGRVVPYGVITGGTYVDAVWWQSGVTNANLLQTSSHRHICRAAATTGGISGWAHLWCDYDSKTDNWQINNLGGAFPRTESLFGSCGPGLGACLFNALTLVGGMKWNLRTTLHPLEYAVGRPESLTTTVGRIPNMRQLSLTNYAPGDEIAIGGETWKVFPIMRRNIATPPAGQINSDLYGYAYLMPDA